MTEQLGFGFEQILEEQASAHLPSAMEEAIPCYRDMIERHHTAMMAGHGKEAMAIRKEAHRLAEKLIGGKPGILAGPDAPGCVLERETAAPTGSIPLWGQEGEFTTKVDDMAVRVKIDGMFGVAACWVYPPGFETHIVDKDKQFLSETGYRSFIGTHIDIPPETTPDAFVRDAIRAYVKGECKGRLRCLKPEYRER